MFDFVSNFNKRFVNSTAQDLALSLSKSGLSRNEFKTKHLEHLYDSLRILKRIPDFNSVDGLIYEEKGHLDCVSHDLVGVIVETRPIPELEKVIYNFYQTIKRPVQLFHGTKNLDYIMSSNIKDLIRDKIVYLTELNTDKLSHNAYNALLLSIKFWNSLIGRNKVVVFQTDSCFCARSKYRIEDFSSFDYIGSKWSRRRPIGIIIDGGNGGFSLRSWNKSVEVLRRFPSNIWPGGEDGYFAFHIELIGGKVGKSKSSAKFGTQFEFLYNSLGCHKISCLNDKDQVNFLNYCPEAEFMLKQ